MTGEQVTWVRTLLAAYRNEHDFDADEDVGATYEMLGNVESVVDELERQYPVCNCCRINDVNKAANDGLCDYCRNANKVSTSVASDVDENLPF